MGKRFWYGKRIVSGLTGFALALTAVGPIQSVNAAEALASDEIQKSARDVEAVSKSLDLKAELELLILFVENLNQEDYTASSWANLEKALEEAKSLVADETATRSQLDKAIANLVLAFGDLEYGVQKQHLQVAVEAAEEILAREKDYDQSAIARLKELTHQAKAMLENAAATQEEVNQMASDLIDAIASVALDPEYSSLKNLLEAVESLDESKYTVKSWENLEEAVAAAWDTLEDADREDGAIGQAYQKLAQAIRDLDMKGNKESLEAMIEKAEDMMAHASDYVESTIQNLAEALAEAQKVYEDEDAGQREVEQAVRELTEALMQVRLKGDVDGNGKVNTSDFMLILGYQVESRLLDESQLNGGDVNADGSVDTKDSVLMLRYISEKIDKF